jgi:general secretion pathway protein K
MIRRLGRRLNRGVALITALLIMALVATLAYTLEWNNSLDLRRTIIMLNRDQAIQIALGAESWMSSILRQDLQDGPEDHLGEIWASDLPGLPIDGGEVFGDIEDLQGRFNINNLIDANGAVDTVASEQFETLLIVLGLDTKFVGLVVDWLDADQDASFPYGAEDSIYTGFTPPYRTANQALMNASELGAIEGMDKETLDILLPHIVALPAGTRINANTATGPVLQSLHPDITLADVESLLATREEAGFTDLGRAFSQWPGVSQLLDLSTEYFQLKVVVRIDTVRITYYSILERGPRGDVTPILRSLGTT